jgi:hypothetical protein
MNNFIRKYKKVKQDEVCKYGFCDLELRICWLQKSG